MTMMIREEELLPSLWTVYIFPPSASLFFVLVESAMRRRRRRPDFSSSAKAPFSWCPAQSRPAFTILLNGEGKKKKLFMRGLENKFWAEELSSLCNTLEMMDVIIIHFRPHRPSMNQYDPAWSIRTINHSSPSRDYKKEGYWGRNF